MEKPLRKIKDWFKNTAKIISFIAKRKLRTETLEKIRPEINKMKENHFFVDKEGVEKDLDLEKETTLGKISGEEKLKLFI